MGLIGAVNGLNAIVPGTSFKDFALPAIRRRSRMWPGNRQPEPPWMCGPAR